MESRTVEASPPQRNNSLSASLNRLPTVVRRSILMAWDALAWILAMLAFLLVRYDFNLNQAQWGSVVAYTGIAVALQICAGLVTQFYLGRSRIGSFAEATSMGVLVAVIALVVGLLVSVFDHDFPRGVAIMLPPVALVLMATGRFLFRGLTAARPRGDRGEAPPALVYGAGNAGYQIAQLMDLAEAPPYRIVGFLDDDRGKRHLRINGYRVLGGGEDLVRLAQERQAQTVTRTGGARCEGCGARRPPRQGRQPRAHRGHHNTSGSPCPR